MSQALGLQQSAAGYGTEAAALLLQLHFSFQLQPEPARSAHKHRHVLAPVTELSTLTNSDSTVWELPKIAVGAQLFHTITP